MIDHGPVEMIMGKHVIAYFKHVIKCLLEVI